MKTLAIALAAVLLAVVPISLHQMAAAQSSDWSWVTPDLESDNGIRTQQVNYKTNRLVELATMPYMKIEYASSNEWPEADAVGATSSPTYLYPQVGETRSQATYYIGSCNEGSWPLAGCYKFIQQWIWADVIGSAQPKFKPLIKHYGPGNEASKGYPDYKTIWRLDTTIPLSTDTDIMREKDKTDCTGWTTYTWPTYAEDFYFDNSCASGQMWRQQDAAVGYTKSLGVDPANSYADLGYYQGQLILKYVSGQTDPSNGVEASTWDNNDQIENVDLVFWYYSAENGSSTTCTVGHPCTGDAAFIPNGY